MKQRMRVGVMAGLLVAPAAVVSANENINIDENTLAVVEGNEQATAVATSLVAAATDNLNGFVTDMRLKEIYALNEESNIPDVKAYKDTLNVLITDEIEPDVEVIDTSSTQTIVIDPFLDSSTYTIKKLLFLKLNYLEEMKALKEDIYNLNNAIGQLNVKNPDTIAKVEEIRTKYNSFAEKYQDARQVLDSELQKVENDPEYSDFLKSAFSTLGVYPMSPEAYLKKAIPKTDTLVKFENNIKKPKKLIDNNVEITIGASTDTVTFNLNTLAESTTSTVPTNIEEFRSQAKAILYYLNANNLIADEKAIFRAHMLEDGRTVGEIIDNADKDIASADKVIQLIEAMETTEFKSDSIFSSKVKAINTAYEKLTERGKGLVTSYSEKVAAHEDSSIVPPDENSGKQVGYMAADAVIAQIKALKPAATEDYRKAVVAARDAYKALAQSYQHYVLNEASLTTMESEIGEAKLFESLIADLNDASKEPAAQKITNARTAYNALTSAEKKVVLKDSYTSLQNWEKTAKSSITVNTTITKIKIENSKTFATNVEKAQKAYDTLGTDQQQKLVDSRDRLQLIEPLAKITGLYIALKLGDSTDYRTGVSELTKSLEDSKKASLTANLAFNTYSAYSDDVTALEKLFDALQALIKTKQTEIDHAVTVEELINTANTTTGPAQLTNITSARAAYTGLTANEKKIVTNLKTLTELEKIVSQPSKVAATIAAVDPTASTFETKAKAAITAYEKLTSGQKAYLVTDMGVQIADFKLMLDFITQMKALKVSSATYRDDVADAKKRANELKSEFNSTKKEDLKEAIDKYIGAITTSEQTISKSDVVVNLIDQLPLKFGQDFLKGIETIENEYAKLSADAKKLVTNYKTFQSLKKDGTAALKVVDLINNSYITNVDVANSGYAKAMETAIKAYDKLTSMQRLYVYNYDSRLKPYLKVYEVVVAVNNLKPTSKTYNADVAAVRKMYEALSATEKTYLTPILSKIVDSESALTEVQKVIDFIIEATPGVENYTEKLKAARVAYDNLAALGTAYQKLVTNYKTLQDRENAMAPVTSSIYQIQELELLLKRPFNDAAEFVKKYQEAMKAYEKISYENRQLITNRDVLLNVIYPVASTLEAIENIKEGSKTFGADVANARAKYDTLSASDKKLITNYTKLTAYEVIAASGAAVDALIKTIPTKSGQAYMQAIKNARAAYDQLSAAEKKTVSLYTELQNFEKAVKNVLTAIDLIDGLQVASNLVTAYDKAIAALDKLTADQRAMVSNLNKLTAVTPAIEVYKMIVNLKPSSETYAGSVQAAYAAYNRLSTAEKQYVTNFAQLQEAKSNIDNLAKAIAKIAEISPSSRNYAKQVEEALALYNSLPAAMKKLVTNYDTLKNSKTEVDSIDKVRSLIADIDVNSSTFVTKVVAARTAYDKLSTSQKRLVSNYFMLEEYEKKLGTMF